MSESKGKEAKPPIRQTWCYLEESRYRDALTRLLMRLPGMRCDAWTGEGEKEPLLRTLPSNGDASTPTHAPSHMAPLLSALVTVEDCRCSGRKATGGRYAGSKRCALPTARLLSADKQRRALI